MEFPTAKMMHGGGSEEDGHDGSGLSNEDKALLQQFEAQAKDLGIDLSDPRVKDLIKALGNVEGELDSAEVDKVVEEHLLEQNLAIAEVIVDGIDPKAFAGMLNTRVQGDEKTLENFVRKTGEEQRIMLVEALGRDIPQRAAGVSRSQYEEEILDLVTTNYGSFVLKMSKAEERRSEIIDWLRQWGLPGLCLFLFLSYTCYMFYHHPESYTNYEQWHKKMQSLHAQQQSAHTHSPQDEF
jgi:hypothetical protein